MKTCPNCNNTFPSRLLAPMTTSAGTFVLCPICTLKVRNALHGLPEETPFQGEIAQQMYEEALAYVKNGESSGQK
jgi:hypothetical protein